MKLFLASEAKHPKSLESLERFVGGFKNKSIAYIPTAANGENPFGEWKINSGAWKVVNSLGAKIEAVQLEDYKDKSAVDHIRGKDIVWFAGGYSSYLIYWIIRCEIDKYLPEILNDGTLYVGSSAGSMVACPDIKLETWYPSESNRTGEYLPGMGLVDFHIYPHFELDEDKLDMIQSRYDGNKMYLLKNGEAVIVDGDDINVLGEERLLTK